jgi:hypothetical protein
MQEETSIISTPKFPCAILKFCSILGAPGFPTFPRDAVAKTFCGLLVRAWANGALPQRVRIQSQTGDVERLGL